MKWGEQDKEGRKLSIERDPIVVDIQQNTEEKATGEGNESE